jgi:hypothetical protein
MNASQNQVGRFLASVRLKVQQPRRLVSMPAFATRSAPQTTTPAPRVVDAEARASERRAEAAVVREVVEMTRGLSVSCEPSLAQQILAAGRKVRGETSNKPPGPRSATARAIIDAGRKRRGETGDRS